MTHQRMTYLHDETKRGFTLIEMLVSTAIFVIVVTAVASSVIYVLKLQRRTNAIRVANDNVRYITDFFSKEIRNGTPNFDGSAAILTGCGSYPDTYGSYSQNWLQLQNVSGDEECIFLSDGNGEQANSTGPYIWITKLPSGSTVPLAPQQLNINSAQVSNLTFTIYHQGSVANGSNGDDMQPYIVIKGTVVSDADGQDVTTVPFETSISLPIYGIQSQQ